MSLPSVSAFSMLEKHTQSTQSDSGGFVIIGRVWQIPGAIQPASPASVAHALRSAAGPGIGQGTDDDAPETILEPFRFTGSLWPLPRRGRDNHAPRLQAIAEVRRPTSPPLAARPPSGFALWGWTARHAPRRRARSVASLATGRRPSRYPQDVRRRRRLPAVAGRGSPPRAAPAPARRRRPAAAGMPPPSTPPDPLPLPVFSLSTLSFPPTALAQNGE